MGKWSLDKGSRPFLEKQWTKLNPEFQLSEDGSFAAADIYYSSFYAAGKWQEFVVRGRGTWQLGSQQGREVVWLHFSRAEGFVPEERTSPSVFSTPLYVNQGIASDLFLYYFDGDPDEGRRMQFRKEKE